MFHSGHQSACQQLFCHWEKLIFLNKFISETFCLLRTPNANMADYSVVARDELHESEVSQSQMFVLKALSSPEVQAFVISIRCAKCTAGTKSNGSIRRRTSARCMSISRSSLSFSRTSMDFSALAKFDSLKLTETHCYLCGYSLHLFF